MLSKWVHACGEGALKTQQISPPLSSAGGMRMWARLAPLNRGTHSEMYLRQRPIHRREREWGRFLCTYGVWGLVSRFVLDGELNRTAGHLFLSLSFCRTLAPLFSWQSDWRGESYPPWEPRSQAQPLTDVYVSVWQRVECLEDRESDWTSEPCPPLVQAQADSVGVRCESVYQRRELSVRKERQSDPRY